MYFYSGVSNYRETPYIISDDYANIGNYAATIKGSVYIARDGASLSVASIYQANGTSWVAIGSSVTAAASSLQAVTTVGNTTNLGIVISANGLNSTGSSSFTANVTSGTPNTFTSNQTATNLTDTGDGSVVINNALTGTGATNEEVLRALTIGNSNKRTGGTVLVNSRAISTISSTLASTTTTNLDQIYLDYDTAAGTVTNGRGVTIKRMYGTSQAAFVTSLLTSTNRSHLFIGGYTLPSGAWSIYSSVTDSSSFLGRMIVGTNTDDTVNKLQITGSSLLTGKTTISGSTTASSSLAQGSLINPTLVAAANSDVLVGLDINPTYTNGSFTGVTNYALRLGGKIASIDRFIYFIPPTSSAPTLGTGTIKCSDTLILDAAYLGLKLSYSGTVVAVIDTTTRLRPDNDNVIDLGTSGSRWKTLYSVATSADNFQIQGTSILGASIPNTGIQFDLTNKYLKFYNNGTQSGQLFNTGNLVLQSGGTFTDLTSARLQINSTTQGFLPPRMTNTQILAIATPANGLMLYNTDLAQPCFYDGTGWRKISHSAM